MALVISPFPFQSRPSGKKKEKKKWQEAKSGQTGQKYFFKHRVGSGSGQVRFGLYWWRWGGSYITLSACRPRCSRAGYQQNPCMVWGVSPCLSVVMVKGKDVPGFCVVV